MTGRSIRFALFALPFAAGVFVAAPAQAMPASCQAEFQQKSQQREDAVARINAFNKRRPTAQQACSAFNSLASIENRLLKWMQDNKDWCQLPDEVIKQLQDASAQTKRASGNVCTAARRQAAGEGAAPRGAPPPGSGIRLPQGAL